MKFLHLADLHLGKRVNGFDLLEDQRYILEQVLALCDEHDAEAVLLAGDIYDAPVPPAAACTLLDWFLTQLAARRIPVLAISGNHDSAERLDFAAGLLAGQGVYLAGQFHGAPRQIVLNDRFGPVEFTLLPFVRAATVRHFCLTRTCPTMTVLWPPLWRPASLLPPGGSCWPTRWWWRGSARPRWLAAKPPL